ncbi:MAG: hypothetical protein V3V62_07915, partial [bacterium]
MTTLKKCEDALVDAFDAFQSGKLQNSSGHAEKLEDNFLPGVNIEMFESDFAEGSGGELIGNPSAPPKMQAIRSSSALVVNNFALWKEEPRHLSLCGVNGFRSLRFEAKCPMGIRGTPPHLDVLLEKDDNVVAIESKCLECLDSHPAKFSPSYDAIRDDRANSPWFAQIAILRKDPEKYQFLNAAQLVKHY